MQGFKVIREFPQLFGRKNFLLICAFWILVAALAFLQDYMYSLWRGSTFGIPESLSFKTFWLLFIPYSIAFYAVFARIYASRHLRLQWLYYVILPTIFSIVHLLSFAVILSWISQFLHARPWDFMLLIQMKLSTHMVYAVSIYVVLTYLTYRSLAQKKSKDKSDFRETLSVKNGVRTSVVAVKDIRWISSEGAYLEVHTDDKKYVIISSLRDILMQLDPDQFKRIHKSTIINIKSVSEIKSRLTGDYDIVTKGGNVLRLSRNYVKQFKGSLI